MVNTDISNVPLVMDSPLVQVIILQVIVFKDSKADTQLINKAINGLKDFMDSAYTDVSEDDKNIIIRALKDYASGRINKLKFRYNDS